MLFLCFCSFFLPSLASIIQLAECLTCNENVVSSNLARGSMGEIKVCKNCGRILNERNKVFCDNICQSQYQYRLYIEKWKRGEEDGMRGKYSISRHIIKYMFDKYNASCQRCGWNQKNPITNSSPLEIHHIDGDYKNNNESNLELLCPNCHSLTANYKHLNREGRKK